MKQIQKTLKQVIRTSIYLFLVLFMTWIIITFICQKTVVHGSSMNNTLYDGDQIMADKISYHFTNPKRYDIIVFPYQYGTRKHFIKRIIGMPGETVQIERGTIFINGEPLNESYGMEVMKSPGRASDPIVLGADEYFVLGDNRNDSQDSRDITVGNIKKSDILGKAWLRIWPFRSFGVLRHQ